MLRGEPFCLIYYLLLISISIIGLYINLPLFFQVPFHTISLVYIGCIHSCRLYEKKYTKDGEDQIEVMTQKDAWQFPIIGSVVLFSLYMIFQIFNKDMVNMLFHFYFTIIGIYSIAIFLYQRLNGYSFTDCLSKKVLFSIPPIKWISEVASKIDALFVITFLVGTGVGIVYFMTKHWALNNLLGIVFCILGIENMMLGQYKTGLILLVLLFFYDIFWVFGTPVMVGVAKNLEGPIKLMFPKDLFAEKVAFNMIGLGDIVIPGVFVALMLRFDLINHWRKNNTAEKHTAVEESSVPYSFTNVKFFNMTMFGYSAGIFITLFVMVFFQAAQPALLYLCPGILISSILTALVCGKVQDLWNFDEEVALKGFEAVEEKKEKSN